MPKKDALKPIEPDKPPAQVVKIRNLITTPPALRRIALGDIAALDGWVQKMRHQIDAVLWSEEEICLVLNEPDMEVKFHPEIHPATSVFMSRDDKHSRDDHVRMWEGEFAPVIFTKSALLKYLKSNAAMFDAGVQDAIKNLKVTERKSTSTEMINLEDDDSYRSVEEQVQDTNLPSRFSAAMPLFGNVIADLEFEARVVPAKDKYGHDTTGPKKAIQVRCVNAREALREAMATVLAGLPPEIPTYYGRMRTIQKER